MSMHRDFWCAMYLSVAPSQMADLQSCSVEVCSVDSAILADVQKLGYSTIKQKQAEAIP